MRREDKIFIDTYHDLIARLQKCTAYDLLLASSLIRKLMLDGSPLYVAANQHRRLKLTFPHIADSINDDHSKNVSRGFAGAALGSIDKFLGNDCLLLDGNIYTVHEIIDTAAHKHGGVHFSAKISAKEQLLIDWKFEQHGIKLMGGGPENPMLLLLHQIGTAVVESLRPLADSIEPPKATKRGFWRRLFRSG